MLLVIAEYLGSFYSSWAWIWIISAKHRPGWPLRPEKYLNHRHATYFRNKDLADYCSVGLVFHEYGTGMPCRSLVYDHIQAWLVKDVSALHRWLMHRNGHYIRGLDGHSGRAWQVTTVQPWLPVFRIHQIFFFMDPDSTRLCDVTETGQFITAKGIKRTKTSYTDRETLELRYMYCTIK